MYACFYANLFGVVAVAADVVQVPKIIRENTSTPYVVLKKKEKKTKKIIFIRKYWEFIYLNLLRRNEIFVFILFTHAHTKLLIEKSKSNIAKVRIKSK